MTGTTNGESAKETVKLSRRECRVYRAAGMRRRVLISLILQDAASRLLRMRSSISGNAVTLMVRSVAMPRVLNHEAKIFTDL